MRKLIFSKFSNERAKKFNIRTDILEDEQGKRYVRKYPDTVESEQHVASIYHSFQQLTELYCKTTIRVNRCERIAETTTTGKLGGLEFEYLTGPTLEEILDRLLLNGDKEGMFSEMLKFTDVVKQQATENFVITPQFTEVFGEVHLPAGLLCASVNNIDMVFNNVIVDDCYSLIDYEWTFDFPIPVNYILYRALFYYSRGDSRAEVKDMGLFHRLGITGDEMAEYMKMEIHYQGYLLDGHVPVRDMVAAIGQPVIRADQAFENELIRQNRRIQIYYDFGNGFSEENSCHIVPRSMESGCAELEIDIPDQTVVVRIDPSDFPCIVKVQGLLGFSVNANAYEKLEFLSNGFNLPENMILYPFSDSQILIALKPDIKKLFFRMKIEPLEDGIYQELSHSLKEYQKDIDEQIRFLENKTIKGKVVTIMKKVKHKFVKSP